MIDMNTDRIEKTLELRAPRSRVWQAITNVDEFNNWFQVGLSGSFAPGARLRGSFRIEGHEDQTMDITVERMEPEHFMSWRWVPGNGDVENDQTTLVSFELEETKEGTRLTVVESGFDALPPEQYENAYRGNTDGWAWQIDNLRRYLGELA